MPPVTMPLMLLRHTIAATAAIFAMPYADFAAAILPLISPPCRFDFPRLLPGRLFRHYAIDFAEADVCR